MISAVFPLRDDTLEIMFRGHTEKFLPLAFDVIRIANPSLVAGNQFPEYRFAVQDREFPQAIAVDVEQIESIEEDRYRPFGLLDVGLLRQINPGLNQAESGTSLFIEGHNFPVQNDRVGRDGLKRANKTGESSC